MKNYKKCNINTVRTELADNSTIVCGSTKQDLGSV